MVEFKIFSAAGENKENWEFNEFDLKYELTSKQLKTNQNLIDDGQICGQTGGGTNQHSHL